MVVPAARAGVNTDPAAMAPTRGSIAAPMPMARLRERRIFTSVTSTPISLSAASRRTPSRNSVQSPNDAPLEIVCIIRQSTFGQRKPQSATAAGVFVITSVPLGRSPRMPAEWSDYCFNPIISNAACTSPPCPRCILRAPALPYADSSACLCSMSRRHGAAGVMSRPHPFDERPSFIWTVSDGGLGAGLRLKLRVRGTVSSLHG